MCPFLDDADPRCAVHQSMQTLDDALTLCVDDFESCPAYRELLLGHAPDHRQAAERLYAAG